MSGDNSRRYMVFHQGSETGPFTIADLAARYEAGEIDAETLLMPRKFFASGWAPLKECLPQLLGSDHQAVQAELKAAEQRERKNQMSFGDVILCVLLPIPALIIGLFRLSEEETNRRGAMMTITAIFFTAIGAGLLYLRAKYRF